MVFSIDELIHERDELSERLDKLNAFIIKVGNGEISQSELNHPMRLLTAQAEVMRHYLEILNERILVVKCTK